MRVNKLLPSFFVRDFKFGTFTRIALVLLSTITSVALAWMLFYNGHSIAHANPTILETSIPSPSVDPWGLALDNSGHVWVADPECDPNPLCNQVHTGFIFEYTRQGFANGSAPLQTFMQPTTGNFSGPVFLAIDGSGNVWFTEPKTNAIGELNPGTGSWNQWPAPTANAAPWDLTFDHNGNLWFTEIVANQIGEFNPTSQQFNETLTPSGQSQGKSKPYGITGPDSNNTIWFTENDSSIARIASFTPPASGSLSTTGISEYLTNSGSSSPTPHLITFDHNGNVWWTEGPDGKIGKLVISQAQSGTHNGVTEYAVPAITCTPGPQCGTHISGIGVDSTGTVWWDDSLSSRIGSFTPSGNSGTFNIYVVGGSESGNTHPHDGLVVDGNDNIWFSEEFGNKLAEAVQNGSPPPTPSPSPSSTQSPTPSPSPSASPSPTPSPSPSPTPSPTPNSGNVPVSKTWYFAEGKVGAGFTEFLTIENPDPSNDCPVTLQYLLASGSPVSKAVTVPHGSRYTEPVNTDLGVQASSSSFLAVSTIVTVNSGTNCTGVVAERPMYFTNFTSSNISSGSDVLGATHTGNSFYFADMPTVPGYNSFITILNPPGGATATITATYYANGQQVGQPQKTTVQGGARGTINPTLFSQHMSAIVTSDQPVVIERPTYFYVSAGNAGSVKGAASVVGAQSPASDWLFAEGYTGGQFQEFLMLANLHSSDTTAKVVMEYAKGHTQTISVLVPHQGQSVIDVNAYYTQPVGTCDTNPCSVSADVSVEITTPVGSPIVAEREMFFHYSPHPNFMAMGGTDVTGQTGPPIATGYTFAEGYTNTGYNEWLTLQNPTGNTEMINVFLVNELGHSYSQVYTVVAHSRYTIDITGLVAQNLAHSGDGYKGYEVSMTVQDSSGAFVAERPMYWNTGSTETQGGSDVIGYAGG